MPKAKSAFLSRLSGTYDGFTVLLVILLLIAAFLFGVLLTKLHLFAL